MLELFYEEKVKGIIIRAWARWHEYGEKSTKYFLKSRKKEIMLKNTSEKVKYKWLFYNRSFQDLVRTTTILWRAILM